MATAAEWLVDEIDSNLARRRQEASDLRFLLRVSSGTRRSMVARATQAIIYAHWEGFVKHALRVYVDHLVKLNLRVADLRVELQVLHFRKQIAHCVTSPDRMMASQRLLQDVLTIGTTPFRVDPDEVVVGGNLNADTLRNLLSQLGLDFTDALSLRSNYIDGTICGPRHRIAHGELEPIDSEEAQVRISETLALCNAVRDEVQTAAVYELYRWTT